MPPEPTTSVPPDPTTSVLHIDFAIITLVIALAVLTLPRALVRLTSTTEWRNGYMLRSVRLGLNSKLPYGTDASSEAAAVYISTSGVMSEESHTDVCHKVSPLYASARLPEPGVKPPAHFPAWSAIVPSVDSLLRRRMGPGFSRGRALVLAVYGVILMYAGYLQPNPFKDSVGMGVIAMSQLPVVYVLGTKNNPVGMLVGVGYEKLNYIHRHVGTTMVLFSNIHAIGYIYLWTIQNTLIVNMRQPKMSIAFLALIAMNVLYVFSGSFWRQKSYNVFVITHAVCFTVIPPLIYLHQKVARPYVIAVGVFYLFDRLLRLLKTRISHARIRPIPELALTRIEIPALNAGWRAGQHVRIRVLSSGMGLIGWAEEHPFTVANVAKTPEGLVLMCKVAGGWTARLHALAKVAGRQLEQGEGGRTVAVMVDGPYGGPGHTVFASFSAALFVVGGSGITFALAAIQELVQRDRENATRVQFIELVWSIRDPAALGPLVPLFGALIQQSRRMPLRIAVHYTRAAAPPPEGRLLPGLTLAPGRPDIALELDAVVARTVARESGTKVQGAIAGVIVGVCGPAGMTDAVSTAVAAVDAGRRWAVGGIEVHEETFGL